MAITYNNLYLDIRQQLRQAGVVLGVLDGLQLIRALFIRLDTLDVLRNEKKIRSINIGVRVYYSPDELRAFITKEGALC